MSRLFRVRVVTYRPGDAPPALSKEADSSSDMYPAIHADDHPVATVWLLRGPGQGHWDALIPQALQAQAEPALVNQDTKDDVNQRLVTLWAASPALHDMMEGV
uniref:Uncharacterized protein n=1 Tax=Zooxanthella nutricula TaxID=1333877 RepID=A0A7S2LI29_9DINO